MNRLRRSDSAGAKASEAQGCAHCHGKFGLVRHYYLRKQFCAKTCLANYKVGRRREVDNRLRQWWGHLQSTNLSRATADLDKSERGDSASSDRPGTL